MSVQALRRAFRTAAPLFLSATKKHFHPAQDRISERVRPPQTALLGFRRLNKDVGADPVLLPVRRDAKDRVPVISAPLSPLHSKKALTTTMRQESESIKRFCAARFRLHDLNTVETVGFVWIPTKDRVRNVHLLSTGSETRF
jgi:hypothetical protein